MAPASSERPCISRPGSRGSASSSARTASRSIRSCCRPTRTSRNRLARRRTTPRRSVGHRESRRDRGQVCRVEPRSNTLIEPRRELFGGQMRRTCGCHVALAVALTASLAHAQTTAVRTLDIYVVDVEGGNATLFVAPSGESLLIDTGNSGAGAVRDAERIVAAARAAGLTRIDTL